MAFVQGGFKGITKSLGCEWAGHSAGIDAWETLARDKGDPRADKGMVCVTVSTVHDSGVLQVVQVTRPGQNHVQLVQMLGFWMAPWYLMPLPVLEEGVSHCQVLV